MNKFTNNPRLRVKSSRPVKSIFVDVAGTAQAHPQNEPEVQTITISDTYSTQHIDLDPNPDTAIDIDEVQTLTLSEGLLRQTIEIQWPLAVCKSCSDPSKGTEMECLASGICASETGTVGNGTQYYNSTLCENAADCGEYFDEKCKWTYNNSWLINSINNPNDCSSAGFVWEGTRSCSDSSHLTRNKCLSVGTCGAESGAGAGGNYENNETACVEAFDCGDNFQTKCVWTPSNTWQYVGYEGQFKVTYDNYDSGCMPWKHNNIKILC